MLTRWIQTRSAPMTVALLLGAMWRFWLMPRYAGWEESDYGNLAMIQGVLSGGFLHYDMNHMPGYYAAAALVHAVVDDAVLAGRFVSVVGGLVALGIATFLAGRLGGIRAAWVAGGLLVIQPEFALYAASTLREPLAAAFVLGVLYCLSKERLGLAGCLASLAFLVRFDYALVLGPVLAIHALGRSGKSTRLIFGLLPLLLTICLWSMYCRFDHGTWAFWSHSVAVNVETGMSAEAEVPGEWWLNGAGVSSTLLGWVLPWRLGWGVWLGLVWFALRSVIGPHGLRRTMALQGLLMLGLWAGIGFVGQHDPSHNLYWKWLCPIIPVVVPLAAVGMWELIDRSTAVFGRGTGRALLLLVMGQAVFSNLKETERQRLRSEEWYRPQLNLAQWVEAEIPVDEVLVLDNIPACWIRRHETEREMISWFDVPASGGDEQAFATWIKTHDVRWVLWYREEWTQAPVVAPFLADGGTWRHDGVELVERLREDGYGWIWFEVQT